MIDPPDKPGGNNDRAHPAGGKATEVSRRDFCLWFGWAGIMAWLAAAFGAGLRYPFPNVLYEPPSHFIAGRPASFPENSVTFLEKRRVYVFNRRGGLYAISAVCTHLGCTAKWNDETGRFDCPCHGSVFDQDGQVLSPPAPTGLAWPKLERLPDGRVRVDLAQDVPSSFRLQV